MIKDKIGNLLRDFNFSSYPFRKYSKKILTDLPKIRATFILILGLTERIIIRGMIDLVFQRHPIQMTIEITTRMANFQSSR